MSLTGVQLTKNILSSFHPSKMLRVSEIENLEGGPSLEKSIGAGNKSINNRRTHSKETHVCGIFKGFRDEPKLCSNQFRMVGSLCDPDHETSVNFTLFLDELTSFPLPGAVLSLHNMHV